MKIQNLTTQVQYGENEESRADELELMELAKAAAHRAYAPYSRFRVGAAVKMADGTLFSGCNQENAAYPSGLCAERTAIFSASANHPESRIAEIAIAAYTNGDFIDEPISPCGSCRQVISEEERRAGKHIRVMLYGKNGTMIIEDGMKSLLPYSFSL